MFVVRAPSLYIASAMNEQGRPVHESQRRPTTRRRGPRAVVDALAAAIAAEHAAGAALHAPGVALPSSAAGAPSGRIEGALDDAEGALRHLLAHRGKRAAAVLSAAALADARRSLMRLVEARAGVVLHAFLGQSAGDALDLSALAEVGAGVLLARDAQDAADFTLVAHRAAEDAEAPVIVVHEGDPRALPVERVVLPDAPLVRAVLDDAPPKIAILGAEEPPARRAASRMPFAFGSAARTFERHAGRKLEGIEPHRANDAELVFVAGGALADAAQAAVDHLRRTRPSPSCGLVRIVALRPFPGPALIKALGRARSVVVLEHAEALLAQSAPLALEVKAAFADALTWAPGYSGIGRVPEIHAASVESPAGLTSPGDLLAAVEHALLGDQARRSLLLPASRDDAIGTPGSFTVRTSEAPAALVALLAEVYDREVRALPARLSNGAIGWDLVVHADPSGGHRHAKIDLVVAPGEHALAHALVDGLPHDVPIVGPVGLRLGSPIRHHPATAGTPWVRAATSLAAIVAAHPADLDRVLARADAERALAALAAAEGVDASERASAIAALGATYDALVD